MNDTYNIIKNKLVYLYKNNYKMYVNFFEKVYFIDDGKTLIKYIYDIVFDDLFNIYYKNIYNAVDVFYMDYFYYPYDEYYDIFDSFFSDNNYICKIVKNYLNY